jgi:hypothetical protein
MNRSHKNLFISWARSWIGSWIDSIQGIIGILTMGLVRPHWDISFVIRCALKDLKNRKKEIKI